MSSASIFLLSTFLIAIPAAFSVPNNTVPDNYLFINCTRGRLPADIDNVTYASDVKNLLEELPRSTASEGGFQYLNTTSAHGLAMCRGDVSNTSCTACLRRAAAKLNKTCPTGLEATVFYDNCTLKYNIEEFYGKLDLENRFAMAITNATAGHSFNYTVVQLLTFMGNEAADRNNYFSKRALPQALGNDTLYALVQCTPDLNKWSCLKCFSRLVTYMSHYLTNKLGAVAEYGSCLARYSFNATDV